jgi:amidase
MTVKESHYVAGLPTTWGLASFRGWTPDWDGAAVARLKRAGAVIFGKTNVPPGLADVQSANPIYGRTSHPAFPDRTPGGSSGGSAAALAAGMTPLELGSDIGGSIRIPAHFCGVFGHKPTFDLVPQTGHAPPGLPPGRGVELACVGPMARSAADLELALGVIAGPVPPQDGAMRLALPPARASEPRDLTFAVLDGHPLAAADGEILDVLEGAAQNLVRLGATRAEAGPALAGLDLEALHGLYLTLLGVVTSRGRPGAGPVLDAHAYLDALAARDAAARAFGEVFARVDVVLCPPFGAAAFAHIQESDWSRRTLSLDGRASPFSAQTAWSGMASLAGLPATVAPAGRTAAGLPVGVQIIGPAFEDLTTIRTAAMIADAAGA